MYTVTLLVGDGTDYPNPEFSYPMFENAMAMVKELIEHGYEAMVTFRPKREG